MQCWFCGQTGARTKVFSHMWAEHHEEMIKRTRCEKEAHVEPARSHVRFECFVFERVAAGFTVLGFRLR